MPTIQQRHRRTDRQTDGRTTYDSNTALALRALRGIKIKRVPQNVRPKFGCSPRRPRWTDLYQILLAGSCSVCVSEFWVSGRSGEKCGSCGGRHFASAIEKAHRICTTACCYRTSRDSRVVCLYRMLYWTAAGFKSRGIYRSSVARPAREPLVTRGLVEPTALAIDFTGK